MKPILLLTLALVVFAFALLAFWQPAKQFAADLGDKLHGAVFGFMRTMGLALFANVYSAEQSTFNSTASGNAPAMRVKANKWGGRVRIFEAAYTALGTEVVGTVIVWGKLPMRARTMGHLGRLRFSAGAASSTLTVGDNVSTARHLAATAVTTAGTATPDAAEVNGASFETSDDSNSLANGYLSTTDNATLTSTVAGATLQAGQVILLRMPYVCD